MSGRVSQDGARAWVAGLNAANYHGYSNWRLPFIDRIQDLWVVKMGNEEWGERHVLPFLNSPEYGAIWSNSMGTEDEAYCVGATWGEWIPCGYAFVTYYNAISWAHPDCFWTMECVGTAFHGGAEPVTPLGLFAGLKLVVGGVGPGHSLRDKLELAKVYYDANDIGATCPVLADFNREVAVQAGKKIKPYDAQWFIEEVRGLMERIGCQ
jgi:hypothetical protein